VVSSTLAEHLKRYALEAEDSEPAFVCLECFNDSWLKARADTLIQPRGCAFCGTTVERAQTPAKIAEIISEPLMKNFIIEGGGFPGYEMSLAKIISRGIGSDCVELCQAVADLLVDPNADEEDFYFYGQEYCVDPGPFQSEEENRWWAEGDWHAISTQLAHGQRFFNNQAKGFFESLIFEAMWGAEKKLAVPAAVKEMAAGSEFFRARISKSPAELATIRANAPKELGAPPKERAANNRMSAAGVPLMYVSDDVKTCIAEVRPSIGDQVVVGQFISTERMRFFDFTALDNLEHEPISIFSPLHGKRTNRRQLLRLLHDLIARPVRATDTDYVMTQALAEYIRYCQYEFDGIAFRSVQRSSGGINYVLFDKSSPNSLQSPDWKPEFSLAIAEDAISVYQVDGVDYRTPLLPEA
jgi:hypothetical protein